jgi:Glycosyl hydrolases family 31 TIM-barrel domain/Glycosyl hydrolase family 31 C-terminal domain/Domain of unknown function (DUF5110)
MSKSNNIVRIGHPKRNPGDIMKRIGLLIFDYHLIMILSLLTAFGYALAQEENPVADPRATVVVGNARFTVLTPELIRMEWSRDARFVDSPSLVFLNRRLPVPPHSARTENGWLVVTTSALTLKYLEGSGEFNKNNLQIEYMLDGNYMTWRPGEKDSSNLYGTTRTLDGVKGSIPLDPGLLSRAGWALVDDSHRPLFDNSNWKWAVNRPPDELQDWYFFGYGHDYKKELGDYVTIAGRIPMPPRFALGAWWSRYWAYTDEELKDLVDQFGNHEVPLDVMVVDMDWHETFDLRWSKRVLDQAGEMKGWTGYTWNKTLFPDPVEFLNWCHMKNLKVVLNLHPASGIQPWEESYPAMARAMGVDPATKKYVPFDPTDKRFAENYFNLVLHPLEKMGVDFWWIDWQQWDTTRIRNLNPTWWLNYTFYTDMRREGKSRPIILARWGGLGDHRYQIGFSGDVITDWSSLRFQPYFTATAANVGFGYWSHDIGGHIPGTVSPELYTRWVQWGAMSPILRTHTTRNADAERRIWAYPYPCAKAMRDAFLLRYRLLPYIYTAARNSYDTGVSMIHPLYYEYPDINEAYGFGDEYFFGNDLIVAPVVSPISQDSLLASEDVWIPPGTWVEWYSGEKLQGPKVMRRSYALDEIPIFVRDGAVIPMQSEKQSADIENVDPLVIRVFPAQGGSAVVYQDEGNSDGYRNGQFSRTEIGYHTENGRIMYLNIGAAQGTYTGMKSRRSYEVQLMNVLPPVRVSCDGREIPYGNGGWRYNGDKLEVVINTGSFDAKKNVSLNVEFPGSIDSPSLDGVRGKIARLKTAMGLLNHLWPADWSPDVLIDAAQTGEFLTLFPTLAESRLEKLSLEISQMREAITALSGDRNTIDKALNHLSDILPATGQQ